MAAQQLDVQVEVAEGQGDDRRQLDLKREQVFGGPERQQEAGPDEDPPCPDQHRLAVGEVLRPNRPGEGAQAAHRLNRRRGWRRLRWGYVWRRGLRDWLADRLPLLGGAVPVPLAVRRDEVARRAPLRRAHVLLSLVELACSTSDLILASSSSISFEIVI